MARDAEWMPWYRRKGYKGDLSEAEKRVLDAVRLKDRHPATSGETLPEDVRGYIERLQLELYERKQEIITSKGLILFFLVLSVVYATYELQTFPPLLGYPFAAGLLFYAILAYRREWSANEAELFPRAKGAPDATDQGIQQAWELNHIVRLKMRRDDDDEDFA